ncbi:hypothetical protein OESDEN_13270, partial [Oesophagostomum dentatum]
FDNIQQNGSKKLTCWSSVFKISRSELNSFHIFKYRLTLILETVDTHRLLYRKLKNALKQLQEDYLKSKEANPIMRYMKLQQSVREVIVMEKQYWKLLDLPNQDGAEDSNDYVVRIIQLLEETSPAPPSGGIGALLSSTMMGRSVETRVDQSLYDSIKSRKTEELQKDCENMYVQLYKLIRKYQGLRRIIKDLHDKYDATRMYSYRPTISPPQENDQISSKST